MEKYFVRKLILNHKALTGAILQEVVDSIQPELDGDVVHGFAVGPDTFDMNVTWDTYDEGSDELVCEGCVYWVDMDTLEADYSRICAQFRLEMAPEFELLNTGYRVAVRAEEEGSVPSWFGSAYYSPDLLNGGIVLGRTGSNPLNPNDEDDGGVYVLRPDGEVRCIASIDIE